MTLVSLLVHDVTILHAGTTVDRYNNNAKNWATASSTTVKGWITQSDSAENVDNREAEIGDWKLFVDTGTSIVGGDRVTWSGVTYEVVGPPRRAWTPRGEHHVEVVLRVVSG